MIQGEANSHQKQGWEEFTDAVVRELGKKEGLVYLLWFAICMIIFLRS